MNVANITATINADPSGFTSAMRAAEATAKSVAASINAATGQISSSLQSVNNTAAVVAASVTAKMGSVTQSLMAANFQSNQLGTQLATAANATRVSIATSAASAQSSIASATTAISTSVSSSVSTVLTQIGQVRSVLQSINQEIQQFGIALRTFGIGMTIAISAPLAALGKIGFEFAAVKEQALTSFTVMMKSADLAREHLDQLRRFADVTPFTFEDVIKGSRILQGYGLEAQKVIPVLTALGDAASSTGQSHAAMERGVKAVGQMLAKGKVQAEEMNRQLSNAGVSISHLALGLGKTVQETRDMMKAGQISAQEGIDALVRGIAKSNIGGMMEKQSRTFLGALSTISDVARSTLGDIMEPLFNVVRDAVLATIPALMEFSKWWKTIPESVKLVALGIGLVVTVLGPLITVIGGVVAIVGAIGAPILASVTAIVAGVTAAVGTITALWTTNFLGIRDTTLAVWEEVSSFTSEIFGDLIRWYQSNLPLIRVATETVFGAIKAIVSNVMRALSPIVEVAWSIITFTIRNYLNSILTAITIILKIINGDWRGAWQTLVSIAGAQIDAIAQVILSKLPRIFTTAYRLGADLVRGFAAGVESLLPAGSNFTGGASAEVTGTLVRTPKEVPLPSGGGGKKGGGGGKPEDAAAALLARLRDETAKLGLKTKEQEIAVELLGKQYKKYNETVRETILNAAREYDARKLIVDFQDKVTSSIDRQREALRGELSELDKVFDLLRDPSAAQVIDQATRNTLLLNASLLDSKKLLESAPKIKNTDFSVPGLDFEENPKLEALRAQIKATGDYKAAVDALNKKLEIKRVLSNLEQTQIDITTGKLKELTQSQKDNLLTISKGIDDQLKAREKLAKLKELAGNFTDIFKGAFDSLFTDGFEGFKSRLLSGFADLLSQLASQLATSLFMSLLKKLFGGLLGGLFGGGGGGGFGDFLSNAFEFRAEGGPVNFGRSYIVGEKGPEIFTPKIDGMILSNAAVRSGGFNAAAAGGNGGTTVYLTQNLNIRAENGYVRPQSAKQAAAEAGAGITRALERKRR